MPQIDQSDKKVSKNDLLASNTSRHQTVVTNRYKSAAKNILLSDFIQISKQSIELTLKFFNYRYTPTFEALKRTLETCIQTNSDWAYLVVENTNQLHKVLPRIYLLKNVKSHKIGKLERNANRHYRSAPPELIDEIARVQENLNNSNKNLFELNNFTSKQKLSTDDKPEFECVICCDTVRIVDMASCTDGHLFCVDCLRNSTKELIYGQTKPILTCLDIDCKCGFKRATLESVLDADLLKKLDERLQSEDINIADIKNLERCKSCPYAAVIDIPVEIDKVFQCQNPECSKKFCRLCKLDWADHVGLRCEEVETSEETKLRKTAEEKMTETVIRECHKCKAKIVKVDGCNKMTCRCGATMCYLCRTSNVAYNHFCTHATSSGKNCTRCKACSLWEDSKKIDNANLEDVRRQAKLDLQTLGKTIERVIGVDETKFTKPSRRKDK